MLLAFWSPKGGSGTSVVAAATSLVLARRHPVRIADLAGDLPAIMGVPPEPAAGLTDWLRAAPTGAAVDLGDLAVAVAADLTILPLGPSPAHPADIPPEAGAALAVVLAGGVPTVLDAGRAEHPAWQAAVEVADVSVVVVRGCYLALRRAVRNPLTARAAGVVLVEEPGRALGDHEVAELLERPVLARFPVRASVARAVDAGVLACRLPTPLAHPAEALVESLALHTTGLMA